MVPWGDSVPPCSVSCAPMLSVVLPRVLLAVELTESNDRDGHPQKGWLDLLVAFRNSFGRPSQHQAHTEHCFTSISVNYTVIIHWTNPLGSKLLCSHQFCVQRRGSGTRHGTAQAETGSRAQLGAALGQAGAGHFQEHIALLVHPTWGNEGNGDNAKSKSCPGRSLICFLFFFKFISSIRDPPQHAAIYLQSQLPESEAHAHMPGVLRECWGFKPRCKARLLPTTHVGLLALTPPCHHLALICLN